MMVSTAGIAGKKYLHVKHFPNRPAYDDYYDIAVDISEVGVEPFARNCLPVLIIFTQNTETLSLIGVATSGRASVAGCVSESRIVGM